MRRYVAGVLLAGALVGSGCTARVRVYDEPHRDYHRWNGEEERMYRQYLTERHRTYIEFRVLDRGDQDDYWRWRHDHDRR